MMALIEADSALTDMVALLTDEAFRDTCLAQVRDPEVLSFFHNRYDNWGKGFTIESVLNKASALTLNPHLRACLSAKTNALDFRHIMDAGKVLIVNLGNCDDETRGLIGNLVTTGMEQAATSRSDARRHFYLYLDEFQDFCANDGGTKTLAQILSECRKYNLHIHLAHQTLGQIQSRVESALGNVGIKVVFPLDYEDAQVMAQKALCRLCRIHKMGDGHGDNPATTTPNGAGQDSQQAARAPEDLDDQALHLQRWRPGRVDDIAVPRRRESHSLKSAAICSQETRTTG